MQFSALSRQIKFIVFVQQKTLIDDKGNSNIVERECASAF